MISVVAGFSLGFTPGGARVDTAGATRRAVLSKVFGGAVAIAAPQLAGAVTAKTGLSSQFTGDYNDPLHPECLREVKVVGAKVDAAGRKSRNPTANIVGWDGPVDPNLVRLNGEVDAAQKALTEADAAVKAAAAAVDAAAEEAVEAAKVAQKTATAKAADAMAKLESATAARDKVASAKKACSGRPEQSDVWKVTGKVAEDDSYIKVDFSPKGGPADVFGRAENFGGEMSIVFPDGNRWTKVPGGTPGRRPAELKTLNSD